jgi:peptide/nickel transport system substrate-binding protein
VSRLAALALVVAACGLAAGVAASAATHHRTVTQITIGADEWTDFDIQALEVGPNGAMTTFAYDRLVAYQDGKIVPYLATKWAVKARAITFTLRRDASCADGTKITPLVVLDSFRRFIQTPHRTTFYTSMWGPGPYHISASVK